MVLRPHSSTILGRNLGAYHIQDKLLPPTVGERGYKLAFHDPHPALHGDQHFYPPLRNSYHAALRLRKRHRKGAPTHPRHELGRSAPARFPRARNMANLGIPFDYLCVRVIFWVYLLPFLLTEWKVRHTHILATHGWHGNAQPHFASCWPRARLVTSE